MTFENSPVFVISGLSRRALKGRTARRLTDAPSVGGREDAVIKLRELVMILDLHRQGLSVSAIARQLGVDRKTVRTYIAKGLEPPAYKKRTPAPAIVASLARAEREGALRERIRYFCRFALLIVDEIGYLPVIPGGGNLFFQLVNARYERGAMILTSNRGFAEWGDIFGDSVVATALLDRLLHHAVVLQIEGSSYRLRERADLLPEHIRTKANIQTLPIPSTLKRRGRPPNNGGALQHNG